MRQMDRPKTNVRMLQKRQRKLRVELLEERRVLAAVMWDGDAGDGLWTSATNWSGDAVPGAGDDVEIPSTPAGQIVLRGNVPAVGSLVNRGNLFLEGRVDTGAAFLNVQGDSSNFGTIRFETSSSDSADRGTYLSINNNATFTNASSGVIEAYAGTGNVRRILGNLINQGQVFADTNTRLEISNGNLVQAGGQISTSTNGEVFKSSGSFEMTGGAIAGMLRVNNALVSVANTVTSASTVRLVGNNSFGGNQSPVATIWLESSTIYGYSQLFVDSNASNVGILRMESISNDGGDQNAYLVTRNAATFTNAASGIIDARLGAGDGRYLNGSIVNQGVLRSDGAIDLLYTGGHFQFVGGTTEGRVLLNQVQLDVASTSAQATLRVVGDNNVLLNNLGTQVTI